MFELASVFVLPLLVAMAPGLIAFYMGRPFAGVALMALALLLIGTLAYVLGLAVVISSNATPLFALWIVTILFCLIAGGIVIALGRKRKLVIPGHHAAMNPEPRGK